MEREVIEKRVSQLLVSDYGKIALNHEIWEGNDHGAHFKATKHRLSLPELNEPEFIVLSVSGRPSNRASIIIDFALVYGVPIASNISAERDHIDFLSWFLRPPKIQ